MNSEKQTVDTIIELEDTIDALEIAHNRIDSLLAQNKALETSLNNLRDECQSLSDENRERWKSEKALVELLHSVASALAVDTVLNRKHRERNATMRVLVRRILQSFKAENVDMDDIPF